MRLWGISSCREAFGLVLLALLLMAAPPAAHATTVNPNNPFFNISAQSSLNYLEPFPGTSFSNGGPGVETSVTTNPNNNDVAEAFTNPLSTNVGNFGPMGVAASLGDLGSANASASYNDAWFCYGFCGLRSTGINVFLDINGTATNTVNSGFVDLEVDLEIGTGDLHFSYSQDIGQATPEAVATVDGNRIPVSLTQDPTTQDWSFSLALDSGVTICAAAQVCPDGVPIICGDGCSIPTFTTDESVSLVIDGNGPSLSLDAFDPIGFGFTSDNPDTVIENAAGFAAPVVVATAVPEPNGGALLLGGLGGLAALVAWRRRQPRNGHALCRLARAA